MREEGAVLNRRILKVVLRAHLEFRSLALATQGLKVLVVMFDLRKDTLHILCVQGGRSKERRREYRQAFHNSISLSRFTLVSPRCSHS